MLQHVATGCLEKMQTRLDDMVTYHLPVGESKIALNPLLGKRIRLAFTGLIQCCHCGKTTKKSFNQGYCFSCFRKLARCDSCIMSPEKCHFEAGTCREPEWAETFCQTDHIVYLANSSGLKVGITRLNQIPTRWMDQGAIQALPLYRVSTRRISGLVEHAHKSIIADRTNWRALLKSDAPRQDMLSVRNELFEQMDMAIGQIEQEHGPGSVVKLDTSEVVEINYPVMQYPAKIVSHNADKIPVFEGVLQGIKGQYLISDAACINIRKYGSYQVELYVEDE